MSIFSENLRDLYQEANELRPPEGEERYINFEFLGEGAVKEVYEAYDSSTGRRVAIAFLKEGSSQEQYEDFIREARIHALLQHPNIAPFYDFDTEETGRPYMVMKLMTGSTLLKYLDSAHATQSQALECFERVATAVAFAHSRGILHLDLKPDNVMLDEFGEVLLCDWGISRIYASDCEGKHSLYDENINDLIALVQSEKRDTIQGTPGFMSPEQVRGDFDRLRPSSDIYSLGAMLYLILYKKLPVTGKTARELLDNTLNGNLRSGHGSTNEVASGLRAICLKSLKLRPSTRYQNVSEILEDLRRLKSGFAPKAEIVGNLDLIRLILKRNKRLVAVAGFAVIILFFIFGASVIFVNREKDKVEQALELTEKLNKDLVLEQEKREHVAKFAAERFINKGLEALRLEQYDKAREAFATAKLMAPNSKQVEEFSSITELIDGSHENIQKLAGHNVLGKLSELLKACNEGKPLSVSEVEQVIAELNQTPYKIFIMWYLKSSIANSRWSTSDKEQLYNLYIGNALQDQGDSIKVNTRLLNDKLDIELVAEQLNLSRLPLGLKIEKLAIRECRLSFSELYLKDLKELDLSGSKIKNLHLLKAEQLKHLTLDSAYFKIIELKDFKSLVELSMNDVGGNKTIEPLYSLPKLERVHVDESFRRFKKGSRSRFVVIRK
jgi:hypothetical protein